jgi:hypothetical protein
MMEAAKAGSLWTEYDLAEFLQIRVKKLRRERVQGVGFPYFKLGSGRNATVPLPFPGYTHSRSRLPS